MSKEVEKLYGDYNNALAKSKGGDAVATADKAKIMESIRHAERASARNGVVLNAVRKDGKIVVQASETSTRRSLREEYVRSFDEKVPVQLSRPGETPFVGTLRQYHGERLLRR